MKPLVRLVSFVAPLLCGWVLSTAAEPDPTAGAIGYNRDIRPLLAENCFACHGPDRLGRKADLRLDMRKSAVDSGAITPGSPDDSELLTRIESTDPQKVMPPPATHKTLTAAQKNLLRRWIAAGAEYQPHWAFIAPQRAALPAVRNTTWCRTPIDRFILAKLEAARLQPAAEADRRMLARRLALDCTGLPPEPADVEAFVADKSPDAYDKYVDRQMASPHWGEHRARYWLDAARYADTNGLHFDNFREMWSYRDWVIGAFNANKRFDRFTLEQLAGDLLPGATLPQRIASGFNRCNITTNEGGTIPEENLVFYTRDRTETTSQVWLGLTANCAVCHDHKFDPLNQKQFYSLSAFFNNTTQGAMDGNTKDAPPVLVVPRPEDQARWDALTSDVPEVRRQLDDRKKVARAEFERWLADPVRMQEPPAACPCQTAAKPDGKGGKGQCPCNTPADAATPGMIPTAKLDFHARLDEGLGRRAQVVVQGKPQDVIAPADLQWTPGQVAAFALTPVENAPLSVPQAGDYDRGDKFSYAAWIKLSSAQQTGAVVARMEERDDYRGWDLWIEKGRVGTHIIHKWQDDALKVVSNASVKANRWTHVAVTYDGSGRAAGVKIYIDGELQKAKPVANKLQGTIRTQAPLTIGQRHHTSRLEGAAIQDVRVYGRVLSPAEVRHLPLGTRAMWLAARPAAQRKPAEKDELYPWWLETYDKPYQQYVCQLTALETEQNQIRQRGTVAHVMAERGEPAKAYLLYRGEYDKRRDELTANTPPWLPPMPADAPHNRLGFARWLLLPEHPLTARVTVNRFWQEVFGTGIVRTVGDLGTAGEAPSHPELLDWLAVEFRESGWDVKRLFRLIFTSASYRQAAVATAEKLEKDVQNRLLSRGPRFRMDGEMVRDYALAASGLLVRKIGGPSVKPYQPPGVWEAVAMIGSNTRDYVQDHGESLYRRSLYTLWKRAAPPASMEVFNSPSRETCTVRRERTNTPLQALVTLNDPQFVEAARALAEKTLREGGATPQSRLDFLARRVLARPLQKAETPVVEDSLAKLTDYYKSHADDAKQLIAVGESKPDATLDPPLVAAWTMLGNELLNLDEVLNK